jgi:hypothetical protein
MSAISLESKVVHQQDVIFRDLEGEAVILNLATGNYFGLDPVGTRIWTLIQERGRVGAILQAILDEYEVEPEQGKEDLLRLLSQLESTGLIQIADAPQ